MTTREKTLAAAVAAAGGLWFATQGLARYRTAVERNENLQFEAEQALSDAKTAELRGRLARKQLNQWRSQSLPTDRQVAESLYQDWLRDQLTGAGLTVAQLTDKSGSGRHPQFSEAAIEARVSGKLEQLIDFLHRFYAAPHLHRISAATITPTEKGEQLDVTLTAVALILPDAHRSDALAEGDPQPIEGVESLEEIRKRIADRNLFVAHHPNGLKEKSAAADEAVTDAEFTVTYYGLDGWQMGIRNASSGSVSYYRQGDHIEFGKVKGAVIQIEARRAVIETDDGRVEVRWGQKFSEAVPLAPPAA